LARRRKKLRPAIEDLVKLQQSTGDKNVIKVGGTEVDAGKTLQTVKQLFEILRLGGASTEEAGKAVNDFFAEASKKGQVTADMLRKVSEVAPQAGRTLTQMLSGTNQSAAQFAKDLDKAPLSLDRFQSSLSRSKSKIDADFQQLQKNPSNLSEAFEKVKRDLGTVFEQATGGPGVGSQFGSQIGKGLSEGIGSLSEKIKDKLLSIIESVKNAGRIIGSLFDAIKGNETVGAAIDGIKSGLQSFSSGIGTATTAIKTALANVWSSVGEGASAAWERIKAAADTAWEGVKAGATALGGVLGPVWTALSEGAKLTWQDIKSGATALADGIKSALSAIGNSEIWKSVSGAAQAAWASIKSGASTLATDIVSAFSGIGDTIGSIFTGILERVASAVEKIKRAAASIAAGGGSTGSSDALGNPQPFASGGYLRGPGTGTSDSILALLGRGLIRVSNGEFIQQARAVRHYGVDVMHAINSLQIPKDLFSNLRGFSFGGALDSMTHPYFPPRFASGGLLDFVVPASISQSKSLHPVTINLGGGQSINGLLAPSDVLRELKRAAVKRQIGKSRTPRWVG
jgi:hypothetical protein